MAETVFVSAILGGASVEYYVTVDGDRVAGPFADRAAARKRAAEMNTFEVALTYVVEAIDPAETRQ